MENVTKYGHGVITRWYWMRYHEGLRSYGNIFVSDRLDKFVRKIH